MFFYVFRFLTLEEAVEETLDVDNDEIPSGSEDENLSKEDEEFVVEGGDNVVAQDDDETDDETDDDTSEDESHSSEPNKKKKTERYECIFIQLKLESFHCIIATFIFQDLVALGEERLARTCQSRKPPCTQRSSPECKEST